MDHTGEPDVGPELKEYKLGNKHNISRPHVRKWLAYSLLFIFFSEIAGAYGLFFNGIPIDDVKALLLEVIGPTAALVGSVIGFYFGSNDND